jgi:Arc/MetJ-type ribon-helix-helix transcriptional regulator
MARAPRDWNLKLNCSIRDDIGLSIYPITSAQWQALREAAKKRGGDRSELVRDAINRLLDERDRNGGDRYIYPASPRLKPEEKADINPRSLWIKESMLERLRRRCTNDRVHQSEFILHALRRYLEAEGIEIDPPL